MRGEQLDPSALLAGIHQQEEPQLLASVTSVSITDEPSATDLFDLYEKIAETPSGVRDAQIFSKVREWTFSNFSLPAHEFAGISRNELEAWQERHQINLSSGTIRPDPIDIQRGHAWSHIRITNHLNRLHVYQGPPSAYELGLAAATELV